MVRVETTILEKGDGSPMINATLRLKRMADDGAPMSDSEHLTVKGGEYETLMAVVDVINGFPGNAGFDVQIDFDPS